MTTNSTEFTGFDVREELIRAFEEEGLPLPRYELIGFHGFYRNNPAALVHLCGNIAAHLKDSLGDEDFPDCDVYRNEASPDDYIVRTTLSWGGPAVYAELDSRRCTILGVNCGEMIRLSFPTDEDLPVINTLRMIGEGY